MPVRGRLVGVLRPFADVALQDRSESARSLIDAIAESASNDGPETLADLKFDDGAGHDHDRTGQDRTEEDSSRSPSARTIIGLRNISNQMMFVIEMIIVTRLRCTRVRHDYSSRGALCAADLTLRGGASVIAIEPGSAGKGSSAYGRSCLSRRDRQQLPRVARHLA